MSEPSTQRQSFQGLALSGGVAAGSVCMFNDSRHNELPVFRVAQRDIGSEEARLDEAVAIVTRCLEEIRDNVRARIGAAESEIFGAQIMILLDPVILKDIRQAITAELRNAEVAVSATLDRYEAKLLDIDDEYIKERASDIGEIRRRLLDVLTNMRPQLQCAGSGGCRHGKNRVIVADELVASMTVDLETTETLGFVTERGGLNSHAAILARALGIPAVSGIPGLRKRLSCGTPLIVNGDSGEVIAWPTEEDLQAVKAMRMQTPCMDAVAPLPGFRVMANISVAAEAQSALDFGAEGIGLYRTEFEFMAAGRRLTVDEQAERYIRVLETMKGRPVTFRLLDAGGDKPLKFLDMRNEENPALGWRGMRLLLDSTDLLFDQVRALARASRRGPVRVLAPMIADLEQYRRYRAIYDEALASEPPGDIRAGVMLEVPAACLQAEELLAEADFASVGSNDLIQYLFAVDRNNDRVARDYHAHYPVFWALLKQMRETARRLGKPLSLCGEAPSDPVCARRLHELGFDEVSVSPRLIPVVRRVVKSIMDAGEEAL